MNPSGICSLAFTALMLAFPAMADNLGEGGTEFWIDGPAEVKLGPSPDNAHSAIDSRGRQIYVWSEATYSPSLQATNIVLRVFSPDGQSLVGPVQINTYDTSSQTYPRVAVSADDSFVVVWQSAEPPEPQDNFLRQIVRSQAFDAAAQPVGVEQVLSNLDPLGTTSIDADIAALKGGGYMTVWQSAQSALQAETGTSIQGRLLGSNGVPSAGQFQVNSTLGGAFETDINVTELDDGGFLVVWATPEVNGRRFTAAGSPIGLDYQINSSTPGNESDIHAVTHQDGRVMVVWRDSEAGDDGTEIYGRLLSSTASPIGSDFRINTSVSGSQINPSAANYDENGFFVIWEGPSPPGSDNQPDGISARLVTGADQFGSVEFQVNQWTGDSQFRPTVYGRDRRVITAWSSQNNSETNLSTIQGRGWSICGIFCDGFE